MDRYILILTDTFEEVEALTQVDYLRRADIKVDMISITGKLQVTSNRGITVLADDLIENINLTGRVHRYEITKITLNHFLCYFSS